MTAAERMWRHRRRLRKETREAEMKAKQAKASTQRARHDARWAHINAESARQARWQAEKRNMWGELAAIRNADKADELVRQLAGAMLCENIGIDEISAAVSRRFGSGS